MSKLISIGVGIFFSFLLFVLMTFLIKPDVLAVEKAPEKNPYLLSIMKLMNQ